MPRRNPTAGQYILSFLAGAVPGYVNQKLAMQEREKEIGKKIELDPISKMQLENLYNQYSDIKRDPAERNEAGQMLATLGFVVPEARTLPQKPGISPEEEKIHKTAVSAIEEEALRREKIETEKSKQAYYKRPIRTIPAQDRERERTRQEISVEIEALEQQRRALPQADAFGDRPQEVIDEDDYLVSEINKRRNELQILGKRGQNNIEEETTDQLLLEAMRQLNNLVGE